MCSTRWTKVKVELPPHLRTYLKNLTGEQADRWTHLVRSPGRINLIGEHIDYTGGLVMPASIDKAIYFAARPLDTPEWRLHAVDLDQTTVLPLPIAGRTGRQWVDYLAGIGVQFQDQGQFLPGLEIVFGGDLPNGAGVSSSAALEGGMAFLLNILLGTQLSRPELAQLCKRSSNTFLQIPSGIMDQFASLNGLATGPIVLNCATLAFEPVKNGLNTYSFLLVNSMVTHDNSDGAYARRVTECEQALEAVRNTYPSVTHLSAATLGQLDAIKESLSKVAFERARYVVAENDRVRAAVTALEAGSAVEFGRLLNASHVGLRDEYEVSCPELDFLQSQAIALSGVAGARMMGGGFGGCTLNLVYSDRLEDVQAVLEQRYREKFHLDCTFYPVRLAAGTSLI
ncbi:Galactokinase [Neolewinella maritima]|uniref:Galactokinase n=1 Tax=Neolewinella maritima TaxID=1383882 RepID=A0ABN8F6U0_9BACT|nr:Galactokinase [Neolewinella maritima]